MKPKTLEHLIICTLTLALEATAQQFTPYDPLTEGGNLPTNAVIRVATDPPPSPFAASQAQSPSNSISFLGLADDNTAAPPDTYGAVGPSNVVTMLNTQVR